MKVGDLVRLKNLHADWGEVALVTSIHTTTYGLGQIYLLANGRRSSVPWIKRSKYLQVIS